MNLDIVKKTALRGVVGVGVVLEDSRLAGLIEGVGRTLVKTEVKIQIDKIRGGIIRGEREEFDYDEMIDNVLSSLRGFADSSARRVINATGIILHTGLGRAALADEAIAAVSDAARYTPVQSDPVTGKRSLRESRVEGFLRELTGAEAVTVVNNNAAATMLVLNTLANNRKVVISRGQLVEIGGAFRMPEVMKMSGAVMKEIGTTNRTFIGDYRDAYDDEVGVLMHVHTSNYRVRGFGGAPGIADIVPLARELGVYAVDDLGSGALVELDKWGVESEPLVRDSIAAGVDLCCFSGDKLIGGAQSGIICGKKELIERVRKNPFARMFRVDKITLAALEATLAIWINGEHEEKIPLYKMLCTSKEELKDRATELVQRVGGSIRAGARVAESEAYIGSGSLPDSAVRSWAVCLKPAECEAEEGARILRKHGVFGRVSNGEVWIDMIALLEEEFDLLVERVVNAFG